KMMQRIRKLMAHEGGFTLIELLIVIVILGILAAIVVFAVSGISDRGTLSACKADKESVTVASEAYYAKNASYASAIDDAGHSATTLVGAGFLHSAPAATGYTITFNAGTGAVTSSLAGC
ncbi:MAG TPA: prepilin-type N-terminal cleavage/methylation domain-containing protein, partial [Actinomycetota bacterium]